MRKRQAIWGNCPERRGRCVAEGAGMGVSGLYVQWALRVKREDPELFLKIWNGQITVKAAIRELDGVTETKSARGIKMLRRRLNSAFRDLEVVPDLLARVNRILDELGIEA